MKHLKSSRMRRQDASHTKENCSQHVEGDKNNISKLCIMNEAVKESATKWVKQMRYWHMLDRSDPNNQSVMKSVLAQTQVVWQWVADALNTAVEVLLCHYHLAQHPPRQCAR